MPRSWPDMPTRRRFPPRQRSPSQVRGGRSVRSASPDPFVVLGNQAVNAFALGAVQPLNEFALLFGCPRARLVLLFGFERCIADRITTAYGREERIGDRFGLGRECERLG